MLRPFQLEMHPFLQTTEETALRRVLTVGNIDFSATGNSITGTRNGKILSCCLKSATFFYSR